MQDSYVTLVDNSVLIGGCSKETFYDKCKPLFDYLKKKPVGVVTQSIKESVKKRVSVMPNFLPEDIRTLESNLELLRTEEIDYTKTEDNLVRVRELCSSLPPMIKDHIYLSKKKAEERFNARMNNVPRIFRSCVKDCYKVQTAKEYPPFSRYVEKTLLSKFFDYPPSIDDIMLLTEACQLREKYEYVFIASTDHHLSPIMSYSGVVETFVPDLIEEKLKVKCDWPDAILRAFKKR